jgi:hypothetical protein
VRSGSAAAARTTAELADAVNAAGNCRKRDRTAVTALRVYGRTRDYAQLVERDGSRLPLR